MLPIAFASTVGPQYSGCDVCAALQFPIARARFVAVSATIPNACDIAEWLSMDPTQGLRIFGEDYRPVRLVTHVRGYNMTKVRRCTMRRRAAWGMHMPVWQPLLSASNSVYLIMLHLWVAFVHVDGLPVRAPPQ
jgi:hypothetical protein